MQQITLTKEELKEIIAKEVREAINGKKIISSNSIFSGVRIESGDLENINEQHEFMKHLSLGRMNRLGQPVSLKRYRHGFESHHRKAYVQDAHDHIRKLTLSAFGVTLNSDLSEAEYSQAAEIYTAIKELYLHLYKKRLSGLSIEDFE
ncbi:hypothetical protein [Staphylococcus sp. IVB6227]|uniref:hypothetical protein n=1 Tax=Staphylococcus sp. IVB6227 TaxID=2989768 RepID=UPI0021CED659|nr:hypothetical protein [Staphylococcus sp. IVB6227]UXR77669.1 hypothetical protein MUA92_07240 [Staphylococcus sp. IVB6227]